MQILAVTRAKSQTVITDSGGDYFHGLVT